MSHRLDPLLAPASIALVGASERKGSPGRVLTEMIVNSGFDGRVYPVHPVYGSIQGQTCFPDLASLPETVDHVVLAVSNERLETALAEAIVHGAKAATIYSSCVLEDDTDRSAPKCGATAIIERRDVMARKHDRAAIGLIKPTHQMQKRALAAA